MCGLIQHAQIQHLSIPITILVIDEKKIAAISAEIVKMFLLPLTKPFTLQVHYFLFKNIVTNFCDRNRQMLNLCMLN
jgi:hypothetical protein